MPVSTCTRSIHFAIEMLQWFGSLLKNGAGQWRNVKQGISFDKVAIHLTINIVPSLGIYHVVQTTN